MPVSPTTVPSPLFDLVVEEKPEEVGRPSHPERIHTPLLRHPLSDPRAAATALICCDQGFSLGGATSSHQPATLLQCLRYRCPPSGGDEGRQPQRWCNQHRSHNPNHDVPRNNKCFRVAFFGAALLPPLLNSSSWLSQTCTSWAPSQAIIKRRDYGRGWVGSLVFRTRGI